MGILCFVLLYFACLVCGKMSRIAVPKGVVSVVVRNLQSCMFWILPYFSDLSEYLVFEYTALKLSRELKLTFMEVYLLP